MRVAIYACDFYSAQLCKRCTSYGNSVCLSVCRPSYADIVSKRRHVARYSLHCRIAKCVYTVSQKRTTFTTCCYFYIGLHCSIATSFTARRNARIASAVLATAIPSVCPSVCLSVCLSHAGIVSKRRHVARCSLHCRIATCV